MPRELPPMLSVRAFEAAARHAGFAKAAQELCVSAGAVAHQIKQLEEWLGTPLFVRRPRAVELTEAGRLYFADVKATLEALEQASAQLRRHSNDTEVTVTAMPSFVTRWLMPRLGRFRARCPEVEVRVLASVPPADFSRDRVDVAVRLGTGPYAGVEAQPLLEEHYLALASPALLARQGQPQTAAEWARFTLLHDEYEPRIPEQIDWPRWLAANGLPPAARRSAQGLRFSHTYLALDAAAAGQGLAVASGVLAGDALQAGLLAVAGGQAVPGPYRYHLLHSGTARARPQVVQFAQWLQEEAAAFSRGSAGAGPPHGGCGPLGGQRYTK